MRLAPLLVLLLTSFPVVVHAQSGVNEPLDSIVAVVNSEVVLYSELEDEIRTVSDQLRSSNRGVPRRAVLEKQVLERLILTKLQLESARRSGIRVDDSRLNASLENLARSNQMSLTKFRSRLEQDGYEFAGFRERVRNQILVNQVRARTVQSRIKVPEREIDRYLENQRLQEGDTNRSFEIAHILIALPDGATADEIDVARERGVKLIEQLEDDADFGDLALAESDGQNALEGGALGWREGSELPEFFVDALQSLEKGQYSSLLRSPSGFHIIKLVNTKVDGQVVVQQTRARHILIRVTELVGEGGITRRLHSLRERVVNGDSFGKLARSHSDDRSSALREGDLGWLNPGDTVPAFEREMDLLDDGEISEPFLTQFGWHIVQVIERRNHDSTEAVRRAKAREAIMNRKRDEELQTWLRQLRDEAYVETRLDE